MDDPDPLDRTNEPGAVRALVVDDDPMARRLVRAVAEGETGLPLEVVAEAANGEEAVALAGEVLPDIVVLDLAMPGMDGFEALPLIRERCPGARVVVFSTEAGPRAEQRTRDAGAAAHVEKGADLDVLVEVLRDAAT